MQSSPAMANNSVAPAPAPSQAATNDSRPKKKGFMQRMMSNRNGWVKRFARQDLPGWSPIITAKLVVLFYLLSALILLPLGGAILAASLNVKEYSVRPLPMAPRYHGSLHQTGCSTLRSLRTGVGCCTATRWRAVWWSTRRPGMTTLALSRVPRTQTVWRRSTATPSLKMATARPCA